MTELQKNCQQLFLKVILVLYIGEINKRLYTMLSDLLRKLNLKREARICWKK